MIDKAITERADPKRGKKLEKKTKIILENTFSRIVFFVTNFVITQILMHAMRSHKCCFCWRRGSD